MEIAMAIITSFIASFLFFAFFQYIPEKGKYGRIRPRIEVELMEISDALFFYLETPLRHSQHFASLFQKRIKYGTLTKDDFEICLYNKCLNETYLFDESAGKMEIVGPRLQKQANEISKKIQQVLMNQQYLSASEILIIEDINRLLFVYEYEGNAVDKIGKLTVRPINPSISYMSENFSKLLSLYRELRQLMFKYKHIKNEKRQGKQKFFSLQWDNISDRINQQDYKEAERLIRKLSNEEWSDFQNSILKFLLLQVYIETERIQEAKEILTELLNDPKRDRLVYSRGSLECIRDKAELMDVCTSLCTEDEIIEWNRSVDQEKKMLESFIAQNTELKQYYAEKEKNTPPIR